MNHGSIGGIGQFGAEGDARLSIVAADTYFDELVSGERSIDLGNEFAGDAGMSDLNEGFEGVGPRLQVGAFA